MGRKEDHVAKRKSMGFGVQETCFFSFQIPSLLLCSYMRARTRSFISLLQFSHLHNEDNNTCLAGWFMRIKSDKVYQNLQHTVVAQYMLICLGSSIG